MSRSKIRAKRISLLLLSVISIPSIASACFEPSPNLEALGDSYFEIRNNPGLPTDELAKLDEFFKTISGDWKGSSSNIECYGSSKNPRPERIATEIESSIKSTDEGELKISSEVKYIEERTIKLRKIELSDSDKNQILKPNESGVVSIAKYRLRNANDRTRLVEKITDISGDKRSLTIDIFEYVNGYLVAQESWLLSKQ